MSTEQRARGDLQCPNCGSDKIKTSTVLQRFMYGKEGDATELSVPIPVRACLDCLFEFTDGDAEIARDGAIRRFLDFYQPHEVEAIREKYRMTRAEFGRITGLGQASLARWELGSLIQNAANNRFLFLLSFPDNVRRLVTRYKGTETIIPRIEGSTSTEAAEQSIGGATCRQRYRALNDVERSRLRGQNWKLRPMTTRSEGSSCTY